MFGNESNKSKLNSQRNYNQIKFKKFLLPFCSESFAFMSPLYKVEDYNMKKHNFTSCVVWV